MVDFGLAELDESKVLQAENSSDIALQNYGISTYCCPHNDLCFVRERTFAHFILSPQLLRHLLW